ncbi:conserved Plasmodiym protein of unknown function [Babesia bovis T2Bo]|uniref:conserved Plasmodiym protein of unknown function n=1 Tax=Babesia bovis T2Bo TaxID=484906 RepID=UPI001C36BC64|nr:conserved Plasmodiym protein of unknown function [Babesia bovis T2Bo]KAG6440080.1 conserved Plasmodiym protein of unknown function [Babesia bovis T2Bo]
MIALWPQVAITSRLLEGLLFLRPRKLAMRIDRRRTKREYRSRRHKYGYYYRWTGW